jgi:hypothetical protein
MEVQLVLEKEMNSEHSNQAHSRTDRFPWDIFVTRNKSFHPLIDPSIYSAPFLTLTLTSRYRVSLFARNNIYASTIPFMRGYDILLRPE